MKKRKVNNFRQLDQRRQRILQPGAPGNGPVLYWMSRDQRIHDNWALLFAQHYAIQNRKPLQVVFCLTLDYPCANRRHYSFLLKGLAELRLQAARLRIPFHLITGNPPDQLAQFIRQTRASALFCDFDPLRIKQQWKGQLLRSVSLPVHEVDTHNIVPAWHVSAKREYAAYTFRPKIKKLLDEFLTDFPPVRKHPFEIKEQTASFEPSRLVSQVRDQSVKEISWLTPGAKAASWTFQDFVEKRLPDYPEQRNDPCRNGQSNLSPYLHFGQISPQRAAFEITWSGCPEPAKEAFLEELIVRRELADNFCLYTPSYDRFEGFPEWGRLTLDTHRNDNRPSIYTVDRFEQARTDDPLWNACQTDLAVTGKLHGYLRMYWAKKILEWSASPEEALHTAIYLNDRYSLDGRDPNGYAGIAWSIGGVHDRAWAERPVFGKIRYMSYNGSRRKFDVSSYIAKVNSLLKEQ